MMSSQRQFSVVCRVRGRRRQVKNCEDDARKTQQQYIYATVLSLNLVIYFTDPMDEYLMQYLMDYEDKEVPERVQGGPEARQGLDAQGPQGVVQGADRLVEEGPGHRGHRLGEDQQPAAQHPLRGGHLQGSKYGWSSNMEKIMQAQTLSDASKQAYMRVKRDLEINPRHPIIKELRDKVAQDSDSEGLKQTARLVYQTALMESGFNQPDPKDFASSIYRSVQKSLDLSPYAAVEEEEEVEEPEVEEKESAKGEELEHEQYDKDEL